MWASEADWLIHTLRLISWLAFLRNFLSFLQLEMLSLNIITWLEMTFNEKSTQNELQGRIQDFQIEGARQVMYVTSVKSYVHL